MNNTSKNETNPQNASSTIHSSTVHSPSFYLVGLGASAGGIQALQTYFDNMPPDSGMAFVVIMHLSPDLESSLAQILQNRTAMPVMQVTEPTKVLPNHVYVIPPSKHLTLQDGHIQLVEPQQATGKRLAIDLFFRALAATYGPLGIAVVLSGTDGDGSIGIKHLKEQGGLTLAQEPEEAEFDSMPRSAIATGMVDWVLPVAQMPARLMEFLRNESLMHIPPENLQSEEEAQAEDRNSGGSPAIRKEPNAGDEEALLRVLRFLRAQTGHDFIHYKRATILRRVARRMQVNLLEDIPTYLAFLQAHPEEAVALLHDLLISVTNFFRDAPSFTALQSYIPQIFADKAATDQARVWVAACATGEEAYSVAMLLLEYAEKLETPPTIQVFATDLDDNAIQVARAGLYPATIEADVSPQRLRRFFYKEEGGYRVKKELRERVLFSVHNLLKDSPFSRLDMVTCRNLLIYLKRDAQEGVFALFHFALCPGGLMFLGSAESVSEGHVLFAPLDRQHRLFVRRATPRAGWQLPAMLVAFPSGLHPSASIPPPPLRPSAAQSANGAPLSAPAPLASERRAASFGDLHLSLLEQFAPPSLIVNAAYDIVHLSEHAGRFLQFAGEISRNLLQVAHPALRMELQTALFRASHQRVNVTTPPIPFEEGDTRFVTIHARPTRLEAEAKDFLLVVFETEDALRDAPVVASSSADTMTLQLQEEILHLRQQLSVSVEQYEASLEELKAAAEEQQSINEEMRSSTEELETSKEELQSTNEELTTVNQELKSNLDELSRANGDLQNLMASTEIGTIFLDRELRIKRYTPRIRELFNIIPTDVGRPLSDITHKFNHEVFTKDAESVLANLGRIEREVRSNGYVFLARMLPYRTPDDYIDGVVLTFIDVTERKKAEDALHQAEIRMRLIVESAHDYAIFTTDLQRRVTSWNVGAQAVFGYAEAEISGQTSDILFTPEDREAGAPQQEARRAQESGRAENERWHTRKDATRFYGSGMVMPLRDDTGGNIGYVKIMRDLTAQQQAAEALRKSEEKYRSLFDSIDEGYCLLEMIYDELGQPVDWLYLEENPAFVKQSNGLSALGKTGREFLAKASASWLQFFDSAVKTGETNRIENRVEAVDRWYSAYASRVGGAGSRQVAVVFDDITERKRREANLAFFAAIESEFALLTSSEAIATMAGRRIAEHFQLSQCLLVEMDEKETVASVFHDYNAADSPGLVGDYVLEDFHTQPEMERLAAGQALVINDALSERQPEETPARFKGVGNRALLTAPYVREGRWKFAISAQFREQRRWRADEIESLQDLATRVSLRIERARAEEVLRESEERLQALIQNLPGSAAFIVDVNLHYLLAEGEALRAVGLTPEDFVGKTVSEALESEQVGLHEAMYRQALAGEAFTQEHSERGRAYLTHGMPLRSENGQVYAALAISYDISEQKRAAEAVRESEERLRIAVQSADMGTWDWHLSTDIVHWNARHFTLLGMEPQEEPVTSETFISHVHPEDREWLRERLEQTIRDRVVFAAEFRVAREDGEVRWMSGYGNIVEEIEGKPTRMSGVIMDITRRKDIEEALRLGEERYRLTVENIRDYAIFTLDTEGHVTSWSEGARRVKRYEPHEIIGRHFRVFYIPEDQESRKPEHEMEHAAATGRNEDESWRVRKDGTRFWGNEITNAVRDETGALRGFVKISRDLSERKRAEEERIALEHESTLLTERNRMAQELHDTLAQGFTGIRMQLEMAQDAIQNAPPEIEEGLQRVVRAREIAANSHQDARRSIRALRSPLLENATLPEALERLAGDVSDSVAVGFALEGTPFPLSALVENDMYRIGQEAVTNAVRHSEAKRIVLTLTYFDDQAHLSIVDNGQGFDPSTSRAGFGVTGMQERARRLGAELQVTSQPGKGTQVNLAYHLPAGQGRRVES